MKTILVSLTSLLLIYSEASAQFPPSPAADLVLGAADFDSPGDTSVTPTGMDTPLGMAIDPTSGAVFVSSNDQNRVLRFPNMNTLTNGGAADAVFGQNNLTESNYGLSLIGLGGPSGIHVDSSGRLWVADSDNNRILMYANAAGLDSGSAANLVLGQPDFDTGTSGLSATQMNEPYDLFVDANDNLWVADFRNHRVLKFASVSTLTNGAAATVVLGQTDFGFALDGTTAEAMDGPTALTVDAFDNLWIADLSNDRVLRFSNASSQVSGAAADGVLGQEDFISAVEEADARSFYQPSSVFADAQGTLWVSDSTNNRVLLFKNARLKANGAAADDVVGQPNFTASNSGLGSRNLFGPYQITVDTAGRLWVCDADNDRILRFSPDTIRPLLTVKKVPRKVTKAKLKIKGSASDTNGIASVRYRIGKAAYKPARGTSSWNFRAKLKRGTNKLEIQATDTADNVSLSKRVKVRRR